MEGLFRPFLTTEIPLWMVSVIVLVAVVVVLVSLVIGYRMGKGVVATEGRSSIVASHGTPIADFGDYINDAIMTPESIQRDREGRRVFSTTKEE